MANVCRGCLVVFAISFAAVASHAQLVNPSFETAASSNYVFDPDHNGVIVTNSGAAGWSFSEFVTRCGTNSPEQGSYEDPNPPYTDYFGLNQTGTNITVHTGAYSLRAFGPDTNLCCGASYASQTISNSISQPVTNGQIWVASGYALVWSGDPMNNTPGDTGFGNLQIAFYSSSSNNNFVTSKDGPHIPAVTDTNPPPLDTWISVTVTATAPYSAKSIVTQVRVYAGHVGMTGAFGSVFWDDLSLTNVGVAPPPPPTPTNHFEAAIQAGNQICWNTTTFASYQPQFSDDNVTWTNIGSLLPGDGTQSCIFAATHKFYRVLQKQ